MRFAPLAALLGTVFASSTVSAADLDLRVEAYRAPDGTAFHAIAVKATGVDGVTVDRDHLVIVDTSASQIGEHRTRALEVLDGYVAALPGGDRARLFAADVGVKELTKGFATKEGMHLARRALARRVPLGATNLKKALETVAATADDRPTSIVYIGDGMSTVNLLASDELRSLVDGLRNERIAVHSYAVGPRTDLKLLGTIAQHTGGVVEFDRGSDATGDDGAKVGRKLAEASARPVVYLKSFKAPAGVELAPANALPLRTDRETIVLGRGALAGTIHATTVAGESLSFDATTTPDNANAYVAALWRTAELGNRLMVGTAGREMLGHARDSFNDHIDALLAGGDQALALGEFAQAEQLAQAIHQADPDNVAAGMLLKAARTKKHGRIEVAAADDEPSLIDDLVGGADDPVPGDDPSLLPDDGDEDLIGALENRRKIATQRMQVVVEQNLRLARQELARNDANEAINLVRRALASVQSATDLIPESREQMIKKLTRNLRDFENRRKLLEQREVQRVERIAALAAEQRLIEAMQLEEEKLAQLIDQVRALLNEGTHGDDAAYEDAEEVAENAVDLRPGNGPAEAARFTAEAAGHVNKAFRLRKLREDLWLETLYQVELSDVPFPDEPPIRWPAAPVWKALTERRRQWSAVDLKKHSPNEERIRRALREQTEIQFVDIPFSEAMEFLADLHDIPIIIDEIALEEEGIPLDEPVNRVISGIQLRSALKIILEPLGLTYIIKDEVMKITSTIVAEELGNLQIRVYPVGDLVIPVVTPSAGGIGQGFGGVGGLGGAQGGFNNGAGGLGGIGGIGGNNIGGGLGGGLGGGVFNIPPQKARPAVKKDDRPKAKPADDPELNGILDNILGEGVETSAASVTGQAFAQVLDDAAVQASKKKA